jgi:hypothetical protein
MSITKTNLLAFVNNALHRSPAETDIDVQIQSVVDDLSQGPYIEAVDEDQTLTDGDTYLTLPTDYFLLNSIILNDGSNDLRPLKPYPGGYKELADEKGNVQSINAGHPEYYAIWNGLIYIYPAAGQSYEATINYYKLHSAITETLEFSDEWKRAVQFGAAFEVACKYKLADYMQIWGARYEAEKEKQRLAHPGPARIVGR